MSKRFAIMGCAGYVAPRHLKAIKDTGNVLVAAMDPHDSVGILDRDFTDVAFFTEFERFDRHLEKMRRKGPEHKVDYISICSPNYLHDAHIRFALRVGAHAICEKPIVLSPKNVDALQEFEKEREKKVFTVLQLRHHKSIIALKEKLDGMKQADKTDIELIYITPRGPWYHYSWKGQVQLSGGLATNIGIHFFDLLMWLFGEVQVNEVHYSSQFKTGGYLELERARVKWFLSIDRADLPQIAKEQGIPSYRSLTMNGEEIEFSGGFTDLHTVVYQNILDGKGYGLEDALPAVKVVTDIRNYKPTGENQRTHPVLREAMLKDDTLNEQKILS
ncbi:MAG: oxidoreductase [candidate division Zixibacteria bacterium]|nr:oxidoreductase [candidate division Zixibacteria bacterium]